MGKSEQTRVGEIGEEDLVERLTSGLYQPAGVIAGPGDDCAVVESSEKEWLLLKTDSVVEGVHFSPGTEPERVGRKAMNRALSDIGAMGGSPRYALVTIAVDADRSVEETEGWYRGMNEAAGKFHCGIVGGETTSLRSEGAVISVALSGFVEPDYCVLRSGAKVGDQIMVTGSLGDSFASGHHLDFVPRINEARFLAVEGSATAMMDLSDGIGTDLPRLAAASGVGFRVEEGQIPLRDGATIEQAISDGEDYELLVTLPPDSVDKTQAEWSSRFPDLPLTCIGEITEEVETQLGAGWEHFQKP